MPQPAAEDKDLRIKGGQRALAKSWPFIVSIFSEASLPSDKVGFCGGSIVDRDKVWVLTAAHCLLGIEMFVRQIGLDGTPAGPKLKVEKAIPYEHYVPLNPYGETPRERTSYGDLALLKLSQPAALGDGDIPTIMSLAQEKNWAFAHACAATAGWGVLETGAEDQPTRLREAMVPVLDGAECKSFYKDRYDIDPDTHVCAGYDEGGKDACQGDSGGPIIVQGSPSSFYYIGTVSFGKNCGEPRSPGVYTRASAYRNWIFKTIAEN